MEKKNYFFSFIHNEARNYLRLETGSKFDFYYEVLSTKMLYLNYKFAEITKLYVAIT